MDNIYMDSDDEPCDILESALEHLREVEEELDPDLSYEATYHLSLAISKLERLAIIMED